MIGGDSEKAKQYPLHSYQQEAYDFLVRRLFIEDQMGAGLFLDPGLGKTRITLSVTQTLFDLEKIRRALILAPLRPIYTVWPAEIEEWGFPFRCAILHNQCHQAMAFNRPVELMNYDSLKKIADVKNRWDLIVLDESTYVKNWSTKRMKFVKKLIQTIPKRIILTGTPAANSLSDLFSQMYVVDDGESLGKTITRFRGQFCYQGGYLGRQWFVESGAKKSIETAVADRVLRMSAEEYLDMPKLVQHDIWVDMPDGAAREYRRLKRELIAELESGSIFASSACAAYAKCRQFAGGQVFSTDDEGERKPDKESLAGYEYYSTHREKMNALVDLREELAGKPLLIFFWYRHEYAELIQCSALQKSPSELSDEDRAKYDRLRKKDPAKALDMLRPPVIYGKSKIKDVERIIGEWNDNKHSVILCQWAAASHGLNMQHSVCADIACYSLTESAEGYLQAIRRLYRQGFKWSQLRVHRILTRATTDEVQLMRLEGKFKTEKAFLEALREHARK